MKKICAWCRGEMPDSGGEASLDFVPKSIAPEELISHGLCDLCLETYFPADPAPQARDILEEIDAPVALVNANVEVLSVNLQACEILGEDYEQLQGKLGGEAIHCVNAASPEGCGKTVLCQKCVVRQSVVRTWNTGTPILNAAAMKTLLTPDGTREVAIRISTEKVGELVLLRIDDVQPEK